MSIHTPSPQASAPDWARPHLDQQLALLGRLAEAGLEIAVALEHQATGKAAADAPVVAGDIALAFARVSRAVRLTVALQSKLIADRQAFEAGVVKDRAEAAKQRDYHRLFAVPRQIERAERMIFRIAAEENPDDLDTAERLAYEAAEQLKDADIYGDILTRPFSEIIAEICLDLGLSPNWGALSNEQWAQTEIAGGHPGEPLKPPPLRTAVRAGGGPSAAEPMVVGAGRRTATSTERRSASP
jgi:hypothetical protein